MVVGGARGLALEDVARADSAPVFAGGPSRAEACAVERAALNGGTPAFIKRGAGEVLATNDDVWADEIDDARAHLARASAAPSARGDDV